MQALWAHARVARLSAMANRQDGRENLRVINDACDRASDTFRKLMLAMAEYRRPPRPAGVHVTAFGQANVAQQQVVQQTVAPKPTNEQG